MRVFLLAVAMASPCATPPERHFSASEDAASECIRLSAPTYRRPVIRVDAIPDAGMRWQAMAYPDSGYLADACRCLVRYPADRHESPGAHEYRRAMEAPCASVPPGLLDGR